MLGVGSSSSSSQDIALASASALAATDEMAWPSLTVRQPASISL